MPETNQADPVGPTDPVSRSDPGSRLQTGRLLRALGPRLVRAVLTAAVTCLPVGVLAVAARERYQPLIRFDEAVIFTATSVTRADPQLRAALLLWQELFQPWHVYLAAAPLVLLAWRKGLRGHAVWGTATMLLGWNLGLDVKLIVQRARPILADPVSFSPGYSFPSGHAFNTALAITTSLVMLWPLIRRRRMLVWSLPAVGLLLIVLTALDRVYLGVHYPSDVTAGVLLAGALTYSSWVGFRHQPNRRDP